MYIYVYIVKCFEMILKNIEKLSKKISFFSSFIPFGNVHTFKNQ